MKPRKAVILAAGFGTRMLPASKVVPKELLPVVDIPAIQVIVEEIVGSGIGEVGVVINPGKTLVVNHFKPAPALERYLEAKGKDDLLDQVRRSATLAHLVAIEQTHALGLGHAVLTARKFVGDEPFAVLLPDDIVDSRRPCLRQLLDVSEEHDAPCVALMRVAREETSKYGIVRAKKVAARLYHLTAMVEKPTPEEAPSDLAIIGRYILTPDIFELLEKARPGIGGEIQLTDSLMALSKHRKLYGYEFDGRRYDLGDRAGFLIAQIGFALKRPGLADSLRKYLSTVL